MQAPGARGQATTDGAGIASLVLERSHKLVVVRLAVETQVLDSVAVTGVSPAMNAMMLEFERRREGRS